MKLVNVNVWHGGRNLWDELIAYIKDEDPDILMVQEAYETGNLGDEPYLNTIESIQKVVDLPYSEFGYEFKLKTEFENAPMGNAILSRYPLLNPRTIWLLGDHPMDIDDSDVEMRPNNPRNLLHCQVDINNQTYNLITCHGVWAPGGNETANQKAMGHKIADYIKDMPNVILAGDFNVGEKSEAMGFVREHLSDMFYGERVTSFNMRQKSDPGYGKAVVDFIFASKNIKVTDHKTSDRNVSDHQSQIVLFDL